MANRERPLKVGELTNALSPERTPVVICVEEAGPLPFESQAAGTGPSLEIVRLPFETLMVGDELLAAVVSEQVPADSLVLLVPPLGRRPEGQSRDDLSEVAALNMLRVLPPSNELAFLTPMGVLGSDGLK